MSPCMRPSAVDTYFCISRSRYDLLPQPRIDQEHDKLSRPNMNQQETGALKLSLLPANCLRILAPTTRIHIGPSLADRARLLHVKNWRPLEPCSQHCLPKISCDRKHLHTSLGLAGAQEPYQHHLCCPTRAPAIQHTIINYDQEAIERGEEASEEEEEEEE